jgi:glycerol uptake facilitator-like aquaporin
MLDKAKMFAHHVVPAVIKPLRVLWNEMIGFVFLLFGVMVAFRTWREHQSGQAMTMVMMGALFAAVMLYYGVSSFLRARKIHRS